MEVVESCCDIFCGQVFANGNGVQDKYGLSHIISREYDFLPHLRKGEVVRQ